MILKEYSNSNTPISIDYFKGIKIPFAVDRLHYHDYHEISFIIKGNVTYATKNSIEKANGHCVLFSHAYELHNPFVDQTQVYERYQIKFKDDSINNILSDNSILYSSMKTSYIKPMHEKDFNTLLVGAKNLYSLIKSDSTDENIKFREALQLVQLLIASHYTKPMGIETENNYIVDVIEYIRHNFHTSLTLEAIANNFFISRSKLIYDFKNYCNMSLLEYITMTRIEFAKDFLMKGYSVAATAEKCGFSSPSYFIKIFSKTTNTTPLKFQMEHSTHSE